MTLQEWVKLTEGVSYLVALGFAAGFVFFWRYLTAREAEARVDVRVAEKADAESLPATVFLHPAHGWLMLEADGLARVGVDGFLSRAVGRVDAVELPRPGQRVEAGQPAITLRQGTRRAEITAPVSGEVVAVNPALVSEATLITQSPYAAGWALRLRPAALGEELPRLHVAERARRWLAEEAARLRELVVSRVAAPALGPTMADGGEALDGALEQLDDEGWRRFFGERGATKGDTA